MLLTTKYPVGALPAAVNDPGWEVAVVVPNVRVVA
jgi:hypothetical protein